MTTPCYIFDIDGTLADCSHRLHHIEKQPKDWPAFFAACGEDEPISHILEVAFHLNRAAQIVFVSGRSDECRAETMAWLDKHAWEDAERVLFMRKAGDHRDDSVVKMEILAEMRAAGFQPIMAFDDRDRVVAAWRAAGVPCAQVAPGNF